MHKLKTWLLEVFPGDDGGDSDNITDGRGTRVICFLFFS